MPNILDIEYRLKVIKEINSEENIIRKSESLRRYEVYNDRLADYVYSVLGKDLSQETLSSMRVISSINLCKRITDEQSGIYTHRPERMFHNTDTKTDKLLGNLYTKNKFNSALRRANVAYNLQNQCAIQVIPKKGKLKIKILHPHHYDVIPNHLDPEDAEVYILSQVDKSRLFDQVRGLSNRGPSSRSQEYRYNDGINQTISDQDDWKSMRDKYVWWSNDYHFITDKNGVILDPKTMGPMALDQSLSEVINPIGRKPFVDVKDDTDGEYWNRFGNSTVDFSLDMAVMISDVAEVNRLQGFAQPIVSATEPPTDMKIGPNNVLFLKKSKDADPGAQPSFEFASPSPDLQGSIEMLKTFISLYLTSKGLDPAVVTADGTSQKYASGLDRLLSTIEKFEASADDFDLFYQVEVEIFKIIKLWLESFIGVTEGGLDDDISGVIADDVTYEVKFAEPESAITEAEKINNVIVKLENGFMSKVEAIMQIRGVSEDKAREVLENINDEEVLLMGGASNGDRRQDVEREEPTLNN